ncbi:hypothetical protein BX281_5258 [Streptomyces sp. Ag82_O1-15]|uniref:hypothetical protein n=1 Tax=Streptomyces sp. Ag82_O1-15 TaxID=1938855 RepID=UPI000BCBAD1A|nr:hypothetical protein [Streptomyces sp. Ag82_O1-15]PBC97242.1 hypothetical protein BX281_5258 [Streptomyces sp. Ag82_O1-15]
MRRRPAMLVVGAATALSAVPGLAAPAVGTTSADEYLLGGALHGDLKRVRAVCSGVKKTSRDATAWTDHQAVDEFGSVASVDVLAA